VPTQPDETVFFIFPFPIFPLEQINEIFSPQLPVPVFEISGKFFVVYNFRHFRHFKL
jgi:hypothetical protein